MFNLYIASVLVVLSACQQNLDEPLPDYYAILKVRRVSIDLCIYTNYRRILDFISYICSNFLVAGLAFKASSHHLHKLMDPLQDFLNVCDFLTSLLKTGFSIFRQFCFDYLRCGFHVESLYLKNRNPAFSKENFSFLYNPKIIVIMFYDFQVS